MKDKSCKGIKPIETVYKNIAKNNSLIKLPFNGPSSNQLNFYLMFYFLFKSVVIQLSEMRISLLITNLIFFIK